MLCRFKPKEHDAVFRPRPIKILAVLSAALFLLMFLLVQPRLINAELTAYTGDRLLLERREYSPGDMVKISVLSKDISSLSLEINFDDRSYKYMGLLEHSVSFVPRVTGIYEVRLLRLDTSELVATETFFVFLATHSQATGQTQGSPQGATTNALPNTLSDALSDALSDTSSAALPGSAAPGSHAQITSSGGLIRVDSKAANQDSGLISFDRESYHVGDRVRISIKHSSILHVSQSEGSEPDEYAEQDVLSGLGVSISSGSETYHFLGELSGPVDFFPNRPGQYTVNVTFQGAQVGQAHFFVHDDSVKSAYSGSEPVSSDPDYAVSAGSKSLIQYSENILSDEKAQQKAGYAEPIPGDADIEYGFTEAKGSGDRDTLFLKVRDSKKNELASSVKVLRSEKLLSRNIIKKGLFRIQGAIGPEPTSTFYFDKELYDLELVFDSSPVNKMQISDLILSGSRELTLGIDELPEKNREAILRGGEISRPDNPRNILRAFAIDPSSLNFTQATATVTALGTELYKCRDWDFESQMCLGTWPVSYTHLTLPTKRIV